MASLAQHVKRRTRSLVVNANGSCIRTTELGEPTANDVLLNVQCVGLCRTDLGVVDGTIETGSDSRIPGHEFSATVESIGTAVRNFEVGQRVVVNPVYPCGRCADCSSEHRFQCANIRFMGLDFDGACSQQILVPQNQVYPLPDHFSFFRAAFAEPVAAAMAVCKVEFGSNSRGIILGDNRIGLLTQRVLKAVAGLDVPVLSLSAAEEYRSNSIDFVIESQGETNALKTAARLIRPRGTIVLKSRQQAPVELYLREMLVKEPILRMVHYGPFEDAVDLLVKQRINVDDLIGPSFPIERFVAAVAIARQSESKKIFITIEGC